MTIQLLYGAINKINISIPYSFLGHGNTFNVLSYHCLTACFHNAVGVANPSIISDDQMTASSYYSSRWLPHYGRLNDTRGGGWAARLSSGVSDWLQIDFERTVQVCAVETQGDVDGNEWVIDFYLSFSSDGACWSTSTYENGTQVVSLTRGVTLLLFFM